MTRWTTGRRAIAIVYGTSSASHTRCLQCCTNYAGLTRPPRRTFAHVAQETRKQEPPNNDRISTSSNKGPLAQYDSLISNHTLREDSYQRKIIGTLQRLHDDLLDYTPPELEPITPETRPRKGLFGAIFGTKDVPITSTASYAPKGLYLYGDVGSGKTMVMDLFYLTVPEHLREHKRRVHFHAFMIDVHKRIHRLKVEYGHGLDPMPPLVRELAMDACVLCFDEFQVTDIADAMLLSRLMQGLLASGVCIVTTSNRHPTDLYKNGIQRESFLPCIALLQDKLQVTSLDSGTDYRKIEETDNGEISDTYIPPQVYFYPVNKETTKQVNNIWDELIRDKPVDKDKTLTIWGRELTIPVAAWGDTPASSSARFTFRQLCVNPLSAADYIALTQRFGAIVLTDVPEMDLMQRDLARRFITFIDACYEQSTRLVMSSQVQPARIFLPSSSMSNVDHLDQQPVFIKGDDRSAQQMAADEIKGKKSRSATIGDEEMFAFHRAVSRLMQMGRKAWWRKTVIAP